MPGGPSWEARHAAYPEYRRADRGERVAANTSEVTRTARAAAGAAVHVGAKNVPAIRAARIVDDHSMSRWAFVQA